MSGDVWVKTTIIGTFIAVAALLGGCAEASPTQNVNISPGTQATGYTARQLAAARTWLNQPHPALAEGWRYAVLLVVDPHADPFVHGKDCGGWVSLAAYPGGALGVLCESFHGDGQAALLLGRGDAVAFDDSDRDQTFTLPTELRLVAKDVLEGGR